jgi:hypothetical protein
LCWQAASMMKIATSVKLSESLKRMFLSTAAARFDE